MENVADNKAEDLNPAISHLAKKGEARINGSILYGVKMDPENKEHLLALIEVLSWYTPK